MSFLYFKSIKILKNLHSENLYENSFMLEQQHESCNMYLTHGVCILIFYSAPRPSIIMISFTHRTQDQYLLPRRYNCLQRNLSAFAYFYFYIFLLFLRILFVPISPYFLSSCSHFPWRVSADVPQSYHPGKGTYFPKPMHMPTFVSYTRTYTFSS